MTTDTLIITEPSTQQQDWATLYRRLEQEGLVPSASERAIEPGRARFRAMYLDLGEIQTALRTANVDPPFVAVYCDVLNIPDGIAWLLSGAALTIIARRVQIGAGASVKLDSSTSQNGSLVFFADEVVGSLSVETTGARFTIDAPPPTGGVQIRFRESGAVALPLTHAQGMATSPAGILRRALTTEFLFASLLYDQQAPLSLSMLSFLERWSGASPELLDTFLRSSSMLSILTATVDAEKNGAAFVPYLTRDIYTDLIRAFVAEAQQYEANYRALAGQKELTSQNIELARRMAQHQIHQTQYVTQVIAQAKFNYDNALAADSTANRNFERTKLEIDLIRADFENIGIPAWRRAMVLKAVIDLTGAVVTFAAGMGTVFATGGASGGAVAAGAANAAQAVAKAAKTGSKMAEMAKKLGDVMAKLKKVGEVLGKLVTFVGKLIEVAGNVDKSGKLIEEMRAFHFSGEGAGLTASFEWEIYRLTSDEAMQDPVNAGVGFARELKLAINTFAIRGQALAAARLSVVTTGQAYANALLQKELSDRQQKNLEQYAESLQERKAPIAEMMQLFYQRYLDTKSSMFAAILGYRASYAYWALQPSQIRPRIIDPVHAIDAGLRNLTAIAFDTASALERFRPPPQPLTKRLVIDDPAVLETLRKEGQATWNIPLDTVPLLGFDRVRLKSIRVWLEGAKPGASNSVALLISTTGNYLDRLDHTQYHFVAQPLSRRFQYRIAANQGPNTDWTFEDGTYGEVVVDGTVDQDVRYAYFEPTAFTQWQIRLARSSTSTDLSGITKITMDLAGTIISQPDLLRLARRSSDE